MGRIKPVWCALILLLVFALGVQAQKTTGAVRGTVTDPGGAVVPGATVRLINTPTGVVRTTSTTEEGTYHFPQVPFGRYELRVSRQGFKEALQTGIELNVGETVVLNVQLEVGAVAEQVTVEASPLLVNTESGEVGTLIDDRQVRELPLNGRSFVQLTLLMPGVSPSATTSTINKGLMAAIDMSISGSSTITNLWTVDGAINNDVGSNRTIQIFPSIDAIEEFRIHRNSYGAEFGQAAGGQVNIVTRGGSNDWHWTVYYFGRNDALNANEYFLNLAGQDKAKLRRHDFGYTAGGPIVQDRIFFFWSQEWNRETRGIVRQGLVPFAKEKTGDFSGIFVPELDASFRSGCNPAPWDPLADAPFPGGIIPADRISPAGALFLQLYPDANIFPTADEPCPSPNWVAAVPTDINWREENLRLDFNMTDTTSLMLRFTQDTWDNGAPNATFGFGGLWGDDPFPAVESNWEQPSKMFVVRLSQTIGATAVNDFQFSFTGNRIVISRGLGDNLNTAINQAWPAFFPNQKLGGLNRAHPTFWGGQGYPALWHIAPWDNRHDILVWKDDFSKVVGPHTIKAGFLIGRSLKDEPLGGSSAQEAGQVWGTTGLPAWSWEACGGFGTCNSLADFLLEDMTHGFDENSTEPIGRLRYRDYEFYIADTWRVHPRLTLDFGIRWSFLREPFVRDDRLASFVPALFDPSLGSDPCNGVTLPPDTNFCQQAGFLGGTEGPNRALVPNNNHAIAPRFGLAWDITGEGVMALRAGFGQFFARDRLRPLAGEFINPPFSLNINGARVLDTTAGGCCFITAASPQGGLEPVDLLPNSWQWNVTLERQLWTDAKLELSYVGNRGIHLLSRFDANQVLPFDTDGNGVNDREDFFFATLGGDVARQTALRPFAWNNDITIFGRGADSIYHSLQTWFTTTWGRGSLFQAAYTWSKLIGTEPLAGSFNDASTFTDNTNFQADRGESELDRRHILNLNLVYALPTFEHAHPAIHHVLGNWELTSITTFSSGGALTIFNGPAPGFSGTGLGANQRPNRVVGEPCRFDGDPKHQWLNPDAFTFVGYQIGTIGTAGRGVCTGPGINNWDIGFLKNFDLGEGRRIQFRLEMFNAFNHTQFSGTSVNGGPGAGVNTGLGATTWSATGNIVTDFTPSRTFGEAQSTRNPSFGREIQYAIKIIF